MNRSLSLRSKLLKSSDSRIGWSTPHYPCYVTKEPNPPYSRVSSIPGGPYKDLSDGITGKDKSFSS